MALLVATAMLVGVAAIDPEPSGWLDRAPVAEMASEPEPEPEAAPAAPTSPYAYLYATYPRIARRMDCVIQRESRWSSSAVNPRSGASGLAQFLRSTWLSTPQGKAGQSVFDPYANIDGAAWLATNVGWRQWSVVTFGYC